MPRTDEFAERRLNRYIETSLKEQLPMIPAMIERLSAIKTRTKSRPKFLDWATRSVSFIPNTTTQISDLLESFQRARRVFMTYMVCIIHPPNTLAMTMILMTLHPDTDKLLSPGEFVNTSIGRSSQSLCFTTERQDCRITKARPFQTITCLNSGMVGTGISTGDHRHFSGSSDWIRYRKRSVLRRNMTFLAAGCVEWINDRPFSGKAQDGIEGQI